jgi:hypothetical protein
MRTGVVAPSALAALLPFVTAAWKISRRPANASLRVLRIALFCRLDLSLRRISLPASTQNRLAMTSAPKAKRRDSLLRMTPPCTYDTDLCRL